MPATAGGSDTAAHNGDLELTLGCVRTAKAMLAFQKLQEQAAEAGITQADVDAEIAAVQAKKNRT